MSKAAQFKTTCLKRPFNWLIEFKDSHVIVSLPTYLPTYLTSAKLLICLLILPPSATIFKLIFRSFVALKSTKLADLRRNDVFLR